MMEPQKKNPCAKDHIDHPFKHFDRLFFGGIWVSYLAINPRDG